MYQITFDLSEEAALALKMSPDQLSTEMRLAAAIKNFTPGAFKTKLIHPTLDRLEKLINKLAGISDK